MWLCRWTKCEHIEGSTDFSFQTQFLQFCLNFQQQNPLQKYIYLSHLSSENCEIKSIKSDLPRAFEQHQECPHIPIQFSVLILFSFCWENGSIINSFFHTVAPNSLKSVLLYSMRALQRYPDVAWSIMFWEISAWQNKTKQGCVTLQPLPFTLKIS